MKLWLKANFLFALLFVSSSAPTPECEELVKPLPLDDVSTMYGRWNLLQGYAEHDDFKTLLNAYDSYRSDVTASPAGAGQLLKTQRTRINGTCTSAQMSMTIEGNTASLKIPLYHAEYQMLLNDNGCLIVSVNATTENMKELLRALKVEANDTEKVNSRLLYLMANETNMKNSTLERFKKTADCLGFSGEPHYHYDPEKSFCEESEGGATISAPECKELVKPLPLDDPSTVYGRMNLLLGYAEHKDFKTLLKVHDSYWSNVMASPAGAGQVLMSQKMKINGTCIGALMNMTIKGNTASLKLPGYFAEYEVLPSCDGCLILSANANVTDMGKLLQDMKVEAKAEAGEVTSRALYLMANKTTVKDSDLEHFMKTAHCLGFTGKPDFHYNPEKSLCQEDEGILMKVN